MTYTDETQSPSIFRRWTAASVVGAALERKVHARVFRRTLYPSSYVLMVGGPGIGKTDALRSAREFLEELPKLHLAPHSLTRASLTDTLRDATRRVIGSDPTSPILDFNSLTVLAEEFGTFMTIYDGEFISTLNHLYDCVKYEEKKRHMKEGISIQRPQLSLISGTTPAWLSGALPPTAWAEGFCSRLMLIYSGEQVLVDPWSEMEADEELRDALLHDLKMIHELQGKFVFEEEVLHLFKNWYYSGMEPVPTHPKLEHYLPRRRIHLMKLALVHSAARANDLVVTTEDFQNAMDMLLEAEAHMPDVFKSMTSINSDSNVLDDTYNFIATFFAKDGKPVAEHRIIEFLLRRMPAHSVARALDMMISSEMIKVVEITGGNRKLYAPVPKVR